jgi:hypothetical protein
MPDQVIYFSTELVLITDDLTVQNKQGQSNRARMELPPVWG